MKKLIMMLLISVICLPATNTVSAQNFKSISKCYNKEFKRYLKEAFALQETGADMDSTMRNALSEEITKSFTKAFKKWGKYTIKKRAEKKFKLRLKRTRKFKSESGEYMTQFKALQTEFINKRLTWTEQEVQEFLYQERLQPYVNAVIAKFENTAKSKFQALKP